MFSSLAHAIDFYAEALYWQPSETAEWALTNDFNLPDQTIAYKTFAFPFQAGFRVGAGLQTPDWSSRLLFTRYDVNSHAATQEGNVLSAFMGGKFAEKFYHSGQVHLAIHFNMFDLDLLKPIHLDEFLTLQPLIGFKGGYIDQTINTAFQGAINVKENVTNNFSGLGPKIGAETKYTFYQYMETQYFLLANFSAAYMWGNWTIRDFLTQSNFPTLSQVDVGNRDFGALAFQGLAGVGLNYKNFMFKLGYEVSDWLNQYQVFDNATGTNSNDLVLQGLTVAFQYRC